MKKLLLSAALFVGAFSANAQIADGSPAPDFTATDQFGNSHTLSTILAAGKTVIIDVSATWCGPCWGYHNTHALRDIYNAYGPDGSDEVMVFYVEGDAATTTADLNGTGGNTQGDWVTGTPYPILDNAAIATAYEITYFPTIYRICPDGLVYEIGQLTAAQIKADINAACGALTGVTNHVQVEGSEIAMCSTNGDAVVTFDNYGTNAITSGTMILKENGAQVATTPFSGNVAQFAVGTVTFPAMAFNLASTYTVEMTLVNGSAPFNGALTVDNMSLVSANLTGANITVKVYTDNYPSETAWEIRNSATNALVASGGPYIGAGGTASGGPDALQTKTHSVTLPAGTNCYKVIMTDVYGDGFGYGTNPAGQYGMEIVSGSNTIINLNLGNFGAVMTRDAAMKTDGTSAIGELEAVNFNVYPNPASDVLNVSFEAVNSDYVVTMLDLQGRVVATQNHTSLNGAQTLSIPVSEFAKGSYIVTISTNGVSTSQNVIIK
jgi:hypothetical protein